MKAVHLRRVAAAAASSMTAFRLGHLTLPKDKNAAGRGRKMRKRLLQVAVAGALLALGVIGASYVSGASAQPLQQTTQCNRAHPCTPEECAEVGAHGNDCVRETTTDETTTDETTTRETTTTVPTPRPRCTNGSPGGAGHDGQPGNDDCAITTSTTTETTTTTPETTSTTTPTTTTPASTTTTGGVLGAAPKPKQAGQPSGAGVLGESTSATKGQLAFTP